MEKSNLGIVCDTKCENEGHKELLHLHESVELIYVKEGKFDCVTNKSNFILNGGDICFINKDQLHLLNGKNCNCKCINILISTSSLIKDSYIYDKYIKPILDQPNFTHFLISKSNKYNALLSTIIKQINTLLSKKPCGFELEVIGLVYIIFRYIFCIFNEEKNISRSDADFNIFALKNMIEYIYINFSYNISLDDIAKVGNVSASKCLRIFKLYTHLSPISYLINYRLNIAKEMLLNTEKSISSISFECGFSQQSYFTKMFYKMYKLTPMEYRKKHEKNNDVKDFKTI